MASGPAERARLLGLVCAYLLEHGVVDLSLSELARGIGSNNRMLLYHFGSLDTILSAAIDDILGGGVLVAKLVELMGDGGTSVDRLTAAWRHISAPERLPHLRIFFARFGMASDGPGRHGPFLEQVRVEWTDAVTEVLADDPAVHDPRSTAMAVVGLWRGLQVLLISGDPRPEIDAVHDRALTALLAGH